MEELVQIKSVAEVYQFLQAGEPPHRSIAIFRKLPASGVIPGEVKFSSELYYVALKRDIEGSFKYGRSSYDYQDGTMVFIAPGQVATFALDRITSDFHGWAILFHPDLIRNSTLGLNIRSYSYFHYDNHEALHLSEKERSFINALVELIESEIEHKKDSHSDSLIVQNLETIIKYCNRYYERQFHRRATINKDIVADFEQFVHSRIHSKELIDKGAPSIDDCGKALNLSGPYLSDLLRVATGRSAKDHINAALIDRAKTILLNSERTISEVAYSLGFSYPQNFSKLFKSKTGLSPKEYRNNP